jgi:hypothetical protein
MRGDALIDDGRVCAEEVAGATSVSYYGGMRLGRTYRKVSN